LKDANLNISCFEKVTMYSSYCKWELLTRILKLPQENAVCDFWEGILAVVL